MKRFWAVLAMGLSLGRAQASAPMDLRTENCATYLQFVMDAMNGKNGLDRNAVAIQMSWLYGYLSGEHQSTAMDAARFSPLMKLIGEKCQAHPDSELLVVAEQAWAESEPSASAPAQ